MNVHDSERIAGSRDAAGCIPAASKSGIGEVGRSDLFGLPREGSEESKIEDSYLFDGS